LDDLKNWLQKDLTRLDKLLLILATQTNPVSVAKIKEIAVAAGFRTAKNWNFSAILSASKGKAVNTRGWEITNEGKLHLRSLGVSKISPAAMQVAVDLRAHLDKVSDAETQIFVEEAIKCHEAELYRSAIVMSWLGAMDVLHKYVYANHLAEFNAEASRVMGKKWKVAKTPDDLGKMGESDFLNQIERLSIVGKNVKAQLRIALNLRNGCGHPNSLKVSVNKSAAHIETLLENVFQEFS